MIKKIQKYKWKIFQGKRELLSLELYMQKTNCPKES